MPYRFGIVFLFIPVKGVVVRKKADISRTSVSDIIFLIMSNTGMTREQAAITVENILTYMREHTADPLHKIVQYFFGDDQNSKKAGLN
ncbi:MAG TPA: hypothetical protein VD993_12325 [Chitinophagaceae bacterium]|nr:hypothetical protein [Chitinophagaceae bacterium]